MANTFKWLGGKNAAGEGQDAGVDSRQDVKQFIAGATIAAGDWLSLDFTQTEVADRLAYAIPSAAIATSGRQTIGVALEGASSGDLVKVAVRGRCEAKVGQNIAVGSPLAVTTATGVGDQGQASTQWGGILLEASPDTAGPHLRPVALRSAGVA